MRTRCWRLLSRAVFKAFAQLVCEGLPIQNCQKCCVGHHQDTIQSIKVQASKCSINPIKASREAVQCPCALTAADPACTQNSSTSTSGHRNHTIRLKSRCRVEEKQRVWWQPVHICISQATWPAQGRNVSTCLRNTHCAARAERKHLKLGLGSHPG